MKKYSSIFQISTVFWEKSLQFFSHQAKLINICISRMSLVFSHKKFFKSFSATKLVYYIYYTENYFYFLLVAWTLIEAKSKLNKQENLWKFENLMNILSTMLISKEKNVEYDVVYSPNFFSQFLQLFCNQFWYHIV